MSEQNPYVGGDKQELSADFIRALMRYDPIPADKEQQMGVATTVLTETAIEIGAMLHDCPEKAEFIKAMTGAVLMARRSIINHGTKKMPVSH